MSTITLPDTIILPQDHQRHNLAIANLVIYGIFLPIAWAVEYPAAWNNWTSKRRRRNVGRVAFKTFFDFISLLCLIRIIGNALYLSTSTPSRSVFVVQTLFSSLGFMPLLMKLVIMLTRILRKNPNQPAFALVRWALILIRIVLLTGVLLIVIGACILLLPLWKAGAVVLTAAFIGLSALHISLLTPAVGKDSFDSIQRRSLAIAAASLPPLAVRAVYLVIIEFDQDEKYSPILGDPAYMIGMVFVMEILVMISLLSATAVSEGLLWWRKGGNEELKGSQSDDTPIVAGNQV